MHKSYLRMYARKGGSLRGKTHHCVCSKVSTREGVSKASCQGHACTLGNASLVLMQAFIGYEVREDADLGVHFIALWLCFSMSSIQEPD